MKLNVKSKDVKPRSKYFLNKVGMFKVTMVSIFISLSVNRTQIINDPKENIRKTRKSFFADIDSNESKA